MIAALVCGNVTIAKPAEQTSNLSYVIFNLLLKAGLPSHANATKEENINKQNINLKMSRPEGTTSVNNTNKPQQKQVQKAQPIRAEEKVNRNAPCPCGSGKKYKKCHGK